MNTHTPSRRRVVAFALLVAACIAVAAIAVVSGIRSNDPAAKASAGAGRVLPGAAARHESMVVYRTVNAHKPTAPGQVAIAPAGATGKPTLTSLSCDRVYFSSAKVGMCLARGHGFAAGYKAEVFGPDLRVRHAVPVAGIPSRTRVSADGRYASITMFVAGDSYASPGSFSTRTTIFDMASGRPIADLEDFDVSRDGRQVTAVDVNFWGVTFARNSDRFYATLATGGKTYLIQGSISARTAHVIHENVECPSLSPDGTRIAFKKRTDSKSRPWRLTVLDLATMHETSLAETRSVDDQAEWLDNGHVLYGVDGAVWSVPADGSGQPQRYIAGAGSPAAVRW